MKRLLSNRVKSRFAALSALIFITLAVLSFVVFTTSMRAFNRKNAESRLTNALQTLKLGLSQSVTGELSLALKMADTATIKKYMQNPEDKQLAEAAFEEFASFEQRFSKRAVFWISDIDKKYYTNGVYQYTLDPAATDSAWYVQTLHDPNAFILNVDSDKYLNVLNLWVNLPVIGTDGHTPIGVLGTGIDLREFSELMSGIGSSYDSDVETYIFNSTGEIVVAKDNELAAQRASIDAQFGMDILETALRKAWDIPYMFSQGNTLYYIYPIQELNWYAIGNMDISSFSADESMINYLFIILLAAILIIVLVFNIFVGRYTDYIHVQTRNLVELEKKEFEAKTDAETAAKEKEAFIVSVTRRVRMAADEIVGTLGLIALRGGVSDDTKKLVSEASAAGQRLLRVFENETSLPANWTDTAVTAMEKGSKTRLSVSQTHHFFVINPKSFVNINELKNFLVSVEKCFSVGHRAEYKIYISRYPRDAQAAVYRYISAVPKDETVRVYAVGGDGIAFDCVNGMTGFSNAEIVTIPYGNANDICRSFGAKHFKEFRDIKLMSRSISQPMDTLLCDRARAVIGCSIGIEGLAVLRFSKIIETINNGKWRFFVPTFYKLGAALSILDGSAKPPEYRITIDGEEITGRFMLINVGNIALNGGSNMPNPQAMPNDGLLDVVMSTNLTRLQALRAIPRYTSGRFESLPKFFSHRTCREITCESDHQMCAVLDGEAFFTNNISLKILPGAVKIVSPNGIGFQNYSGKTRGETAL